MYYDYVPCRNIPIHVKKKKRRCIDVIRIETIAHMQVYTGKETSGEHGLGAPLLISES